MRRRLPLPVLLLLGGALLVGCSDDDPAADSPSSSTAASGTAAVCSSLDSLQTSVAALAKAPVNDGGIAGLQTAFSTVQADAKQVVDDAQDEYSEQSDQLDADVTAVQKALGDAASNPSGATLQAVGSAIRTLSGDVTSFAGDIGSTC
jgi:hypothetical protein